MPALKNRLPLPREWVSGGQPDKLPPECLEMALTQQGAEKVAGRTGTPRMAEAVGTGRALAWDRRGNPHAKHLHPFQGQGDHIY